MSEGAGAERAGAEAPESSRGSWRELGMLLAGALVAIASTTARGYLERQRQLEAARSTIREEILSHRQLSPADLARYRAAAGARPQAVVELPGIGGGAPQRFSLEALEVVPPPFARVAFEYSRAALAAEEPRRRWEIVRYYDALARAEVASERARAEVGRSRSATIREEVLLHRGRVRLHNLEVLNALVLAGELRPVLLGDAAAAPPPGSPPR